MSQVTNFAGPESLGLLGNGGSWIQTYTGRKIDPLNPNPDNICIDDIAAALSKLCRWTGHCANFYSVATHSRNASFMVEAGYELEALLHDASEAYLADMARPVKTHFPEYKVFEHRLERAIAEKFNLRHPWPQAVKLVDNQLLRAEAEQLFTFPPLDDWHLNLPKFERPVFIYGELPEEGRLSFLARYKELTKK